MTKKPSGTHLIDTGPQVSQRLSCPLWDCDALSRQNEPGSVCPPEGFHRAMQAALRFLSYRARSRVEVQRRLNRSFPSSIIECVLQELGNLGYLDDTAFAQEWRRNREETRPRSQEVLKRELLSLGVEAEVILNTLSDFDDPANAYRAALPLARRLAGTAYPEFRKRAWSHLRRRGFDHTTIADVVSRLWWELTDSEHCAIDADSQEQE